MPKTYLTAIDDRNHKTWGNSDREGAAGWDNWFPIKRYYPVTLQSLIVIQDKGVCDLQPLNHPVNCLIIKCFYCAKTLQYNWISPCFRSSSFFFLSFCWGCESSPLLVIMTIWDWFSRIVAPSPHSSSHHPTLLPTNFTFKPLSLQHRLQRPIGPH